MKYLSLLLLTALLTGCAKDGRYPNRYCDLTATIWGHPNDVLTDRTAHQIETHNETRTRICKD